MKVEIKEHGTNIIHELELPYYSRTACHFTCIYNEKEAIQIFEGNGNEFSISITSPSVAVTGKIQKISKEEFNAQLDLCKTKLLSMIELAEKQHNDGI